jgi:hypothetical protein
MERLLTPKEIEIAREAGYNANGLRYTIEELQKIVPENLTMEELAQYVDAITFIKVKNNDVIFFRNQLIPIPEGQTVVVTATGLGNLAHIALNMSDDETRTKASLLFYQILSNYKSGKTS